MSPASDAPLDVPATLRMLTELARQQEHKAEEFREPYTGGDDATQRMLDSSAKHFDRVASELRSLGARLSELVNTAFQNTVALLKGAVVVQPAAPETPNG